jgi:hypothetical protein
MSNPARSGAWAPAALSLTLITALAVAADDARNPLETPPAGRAAAPAQTTYLVRCWQYGRLLFEERDLTQLPEITGGLRLRSTDRNRQAVYVTDTGNATCLIRSTPVRR